MLLNRKNVVKKIGDCEIKDEHKNVEVFLETGNIWMCEVCRDEEERLTKRNAESRAVIEEARKLDATIELKQDVFNAGTIPIMELQAAIEQNTEIPADKKLYALVAEMSLRIDKLTEVIFVDEAALKVKRDERAAWIVNIQNFQAKLRTEEREKFKQYDVNYKPQTPKSIKPKAVKAPSKTFNKAALYDAAKKYDVPALQVQSIIVSRGMSADDAAKYLAELLGKL